MKVISVNVGLPRTVLWKGEAVITGIFKEPVAGPVPLRQHNLAGDRQADLSAHGGPAKAVYAYPSEHYEYWQAEFPGMILPWGMFGENLTTLGFSEESVCIGDRLRIGTAEVVVTQPRFPCYKLALKFGREELVNRFLASGRSGFYLAVVQEGEVQAGEAVEVVHRDGRRVRVADIVRLHRDGGRDLDLLERAASVEALPASWRERFRRKLEQIEAGR
jgi:MOSC domain-containing protein YiiM